MQASIYALSAWHLHTEIWIAPRQPSLYDVHPDEKHLFMRWIEEIAISGQRDADIAR
ncbi:hypothetical protein CHELA20_50815 [Hyphomicrobiales bacterium]|nr:hypothetical protein CHELA20_50815 [Hyphomicrobiales bacterium]CAH1676101.1 hypothetical protein CHELA41_24202 [Hyphomicrobiales bacterium]